MRAAPGPESHSAAENSLIRGSAWRIRFHPGPVNDQEPLVVINEPANLVAVAEAATFTDILDAPREATDAKSAETSGNAVGEPVERPLLLLCLPPGSGLSPDVESRLEAWLREGHAVPPSRAGLRTSRVVWSSDRAVIYAGPEQMNEAMDAVLRFTVVARLTSQLEETMAATWPVLAEHAPLTHAITGRQQRLQPVVNAMTLRASHMMAMLLRLESSLEQLDPVLQTASKRLFAELVQQGAIYERLEILEDPVEYAGDVYELANSRLLEDKYARQSHLAEKWIAVLIAAELLVLALQTYGLLWQR
ncbi:MAG: hypothetical protein ABSC72_11250 [Methylovirgula sp.]|jgi:hypothetical protein